MTGSTGLTEKRSTSREPWSCTRTASYSPIVRFQQSQQYRQSAVLRIAVQLPAHAAEEDQPQDQLEELLEELGRIETQQDKLRDAVKHNKQIVIHPRQEVRLGAPLLQPSSHANSHSSRLDRV